MLMWSLNNYQVLIIAFSIKHIKKTVAVGEIYNMFVIQKGLNYQLIEMFNTVIEKGFHDYCKKGVCTIAIEMRPPQLSYKNSLRHWCR